MNNPLPQRFILGTRVDATTVNDAAAQIVHWAAAGESRYVCVCNVHMVMEAHDAAEFRGIVNAADLVTPDGMPLVWALRRMGVEYATRVDGSALMLAVCDAAALSGTPICVYGGSEETQIAFEGFYRDRFPTGRLVCRIAPPFGPVTAVEDEQHTEQIVRSGARIVFVALGCPRQEQWMAAHKGKIPAVMIGVGAALDFHAGHVPRAPAWMQRVGLEWLFRLIVEPRRLWRRYLWHNPRFLVLLALQLIGSRRVDSGE